MDNKIKILFLTANPTTTPLRLDEEMREIQESVTRSRYGSKFELELHQRWAVGFKDLWRAMLEVEPHIVHFSGHGQGVEIPLSQVSNPSPVSESIEEGLILESEAGEQARLIDGEALTGLFSLFSNTVKVVFLNCCFSATQAQAIAKKIPYVIGMRKVIGDRAAIEFATGFYDALGAGRTVDFAYCLACSAIQPSDIAEHLTPVMVQKDQGGMVRLWNFKDFCEEKSLLNSTSRYTMTWSPTSDSSPEPPSHSTSADPLSQAEESSEKEIPDERQITQVPKKVSDQNITINNSRVGGSVTQSGGDIHHHQPSNQKASSSILQWFNQLFKSD